MKVKNYWFQILVWGLCIVLGARLYYLVRDDKQKEAERNIQLQQQANVIEQSDTAKLEALTEIYDKFYSQLEVRDIVCWGDSAMVGINDFSLPLSLKTVIDETLFSQLNKTFSSVLEQDEYKTPSIDIKNMGISAEDMRLILIRAGVNTMELGEWIKIPSETEPVTVKLMDDEAWESDLKDDQLHFSKQREDKFGKVWINDVKGSLVATDDWFDSSHPRYAFVRDEEGDWVNADSGTVVNIESATKYIGDVPIFYFENSSGRSTEGLVSDIKALVDRYAILGEDNGDENIDGESDDSIDEDNSDVEERGYDLPFVVLCKTDENSDLDSALKNAFGARYIRSDITSGVAYAASFKKLAQSVYDNLDQQGCFKDIKAEMALVIEEANGL